MNFIELGEILLKKADERGYISEADLIFISLDLGYSNSYFNANFSFIRKFKIVSKLIEQGDEKVYFFDRDKFKAIKKRYIEGKKKAVK